MPGSKSQPRKCVLWRRTLHGTEKRWLVAAEVAFGYFGEHRNVAFTLDMLACDEPNITATVKLSGRLQPIKPLSCLETEVGTLGSVKFCRGCCKKNYVVEAKALLIIRWMVGTREE